MIIYEFYLKKYCLFYLCFSLVFNIITLIVFESGIVIESLGSLIFGISALLVAITTYFLIIYKKFSKKSEHSNKIWNMYLKSTFIISILFGLSYIITQGNPNSIYWIPLKIILLPFFPLMLIFNLANADILVLIVIIVSMWINCICYYYSFKSQVNLK